MCQPCYFNKLSTTSSTVSELNKTVIHIKNSLTDCLDKVNNAHSLVSSMHQEISQRIDDCETKVAETERIVKNFIDQGVSNAITITGLKKSSFNNVGALRSFLHSLLSVLQVEDLHQVFDYKWMGEKLTVYFLNDKLVSKIMKTYNGLVNNHLGGISSDEYSDLKLNSACIIKFTLEPTFPDALSRKIDNSDIERLSKDLKISGFQYLVTETVDDLEQYVIAVAMYLSTTITRSDFFVRRINQSSDCIATFHNPAVRDKIFYGFLNKMKVARTGGIPMDELKHIPCLSNVNLNECLCTSSRIIYHFCHQLKTYYKKIHSYSTRRGRVAVKVMESDNLKIVSSLNELYKIVFVGEQH